MIVTMVSEPSALEALLQLVHQRQQAVSDALHAVENGQEFSLAVRSAFGVLTPLHAEVLRQAIHNGAITREDLVAAVDNGAALTAKLAIHQRRVSLSYETLLDAVGDTPRATPDLAFESPVEVSGPQGRFTLMISNGYELWRAASFCTQEPETVAWLDDTFHNGDCLYDVGANIGLYTLYALAKTTNARVVCFEPDAVNYYRLSLNVVANNFGPRALLFPLALSETTGLAAFNSSLLMAGKAENWLSPGAELMGQEPQRHALQRDPRLRTGCATFHLDGLLEQAAFLPLPTHLKIDVDSVEVAILRGARQTLRNPRVRHLLVELYDSDLGQAREALEAAGFHYIRSVAQQNVLPCYETVLGNHIFAKKPETWRP
jgi:FkbM family methyltransferase